MGPRTYTSAVMLSHLVLAALFQNEVNELK